MSEQEKELRQRKYPRIKESCKVKYRIVQDTERQLEKQGGAAVNISGGGMCFSSDEEIELGSMITLEMTLSGLSAPVVSLARVVWCERSEGPEGFDVGVEFWWIGWADEEAQAKMLKYIDLKLGDLGIDEESGE